MRAIATALLTTASTVSAQEVQRAGEPVTRHGFRPPPDGEFEIVPKPVPSAEEYANYGFMDIATSCSSAKAESGRTND